jgi:hypothetical protein
MSSKKNETGTSSTRLRSWDEETIYGGYGRRIFRHSCQDQMRNVVAHLPVSQSMITGTVSPA